MIVSRSIPAPPPAVNLANYLILNYDPLRPSDSVVLTPEEIKRRAIESREKALANFPFERVDVPGKRALATWEQLKSAGRGFPVVIGDDESFGHLLEPFGPTWPDKRPVADVLAAADGIRHPEGLAARRAEE